MAGTVDQACGKIVILVTRAQCFTQSSSAVHQKVMGSELHIPGRKLSPPPAPGAARAAMFFPGGVPPRGYAMFWRSEGFSTFQDFCLKKDDSEFRNWKQMGSDWNETQDSDPRGLRGPPKGFYRRKVR